MRTWIAWPVAAIFTIATILLTYQHRSKNAHEETKPVADLAPSSATTPAEPAKAASPVPKSMAISPPKEKTAPATIRKVPDERNEEEDAISSTYVASFGFAENLVSPPKAEQPPDLLEWSASHSEPDPIMELRTTETVRPDDGPILTVTFGDIPQPNIKLEQRSLSFDTRGEAPSSSSVSDVATSGPLW